MTLLRPGTSPPPVRMPIRRVALLAMQAAPGRSRCAGGAARCVPRVRQHDRYRARSRGVRCRAMHYELYMSAALRGGPRGRAPGSAPTAPWRSSTRPWWPTVASRSRPPGTRPRTRSWCASARRPAASGAATLAGLTVFAVVEPCAMCVGALLADRRGRRRLRARRPGRRRLRLASSQLAGRAAAAAACGS